MRNILISLGKPRTIELDGELAAILASSESPSVQIIHPSMEPVAMGVVKWVESPSASTPLHDLTPKEFERTVAKILMANGICSHADCIGGPDDRGIDIACSEPAGLVVVQCKRYQTGSRITAKQIQHFHAMAVHRRAVRSIFVTTSSFTKPAINQARAFGIELIDGDELARLVHSVSDQNSAAVAGSDAAKAGFPPAPVPLHQRKYCIHCGQQIEMRQSAQGQWWPIGADGTWHRCVPKDFIPQASPASGYPDWPSPAQLRSQKKRGWWKRFLSR